MRRILYTIPLLLYSDIAFTQNVQLTVEEKENIKSNLTLMTADSALTLCLHSLAAMSFQEVEARDKKSIMGVIEIMNHLEKVNATNSQYYSLKAVAYDLLEIHEKAIMLQSRAISLEPSNGRLYQARAETKQKMKNYYGAVLDYSKAVSFYPNDPDIYTKRAWCYIMTDQWGMAKSDAEKAILMDKNKGENYLIRGLVHIQFERKKEGCLDFDKAGDLGESRAFQAMKDFCMP